MKKSGEIINALCEYFGNDTRRINHFLKVYGFAKTIAECEKADEKTLEIIEAAAIVHDIGIKLSEEKYGSSAGKYQELEGPAPARELLLRIGCEEKLTDRVCFLVAHHHTYDKVDGLDHQVLIEADFLVNAFEDGLSKEAIKTAEEKIFRTKAGIRLLNTLYL